MKFYITKFSIRPLETLFSKIPFLGGLFNAGVVFVSIVDKILNYSHMKKRLLIIAIATMLVACGGGNRTTAANEISDVKWSEKDLCAVIFLGYGESFATVSATEIFKEACEKFPSLKSVTKFAAEAEGDEIYYIIPRYGDATVTVNEYRFDMENMKEIIGMELYRGGGEPILIRCNISDIHPNVKVAVTANKEMVTFSPTSGTGDMAEPMFFKSLFVENGFGSIEDRSASIEDDSPVNSATDYEYVGVRAAITNGKVTIRFNRDKFDGMLLNPEVLNNLKERSYNVVNSGICKSVFIGDVGQEINPVLACILEDGGIELLDIHDALVNSNFETTGRLPGYENILSVINSGLTDIIDGEEFTWGAALFAVNAEGNQILIESELRDNLCGRWLHIANEKGTEMAFLLDFNSNWEVSYRSGLPNSEALEIFMGRVWKIEEQNNGKIATITYGYEMTEADNSEMTGIQPDKTVRRGSFKVEVSDSNNYIDVTCISGLLFYPNEMGSKVRFGIVGDRGNALG